MVSKLWTDRLNSYCIYDIKKVLDAFLTEVPDEPETDDLAPSPRDLFGKPSNSLKDWLRNHDTTMDLLCFSNLVLP